MTRSKRTSGAAKQRKDDIIRVRVTSEQKHALINRAERDGLELSAWTRQQIFRAAGLLPDAGGDASASVATPRSPHK